MINSLSIVIVSCDSYSDAWDTFFNCFCIYWGDCCFKKYFVNNEKEISYCGVTKINTGPEISWSSKVRTALSRIDTEYVLFLLEDYFLTKKVDNEKINDYLLFMGNNHIDYLSFMPVKGMVKTGQMLISQISEKNIYGKVLQPSIWRKDYLNKCLYDNDFSAWQFEAKQKILSPIRVIGKDCCTSVLGIGWKNGILQGKWYPPTIRYLKKEGILIDTSKRGLLSFDKTIKYQMKSKVFNIMPVSMIKTTRKVLERIGYKFITPN